MENTLVISKQELIELIVKIYKGNLSEKDKENTIRTTCQLLIEMSTPLKC